MKNKLKFPILKFALLSVMALGVNAYSADATSNLGVSASVANACSISTTPVAFGAYDSVLKAEVNQTGTVTVTCTLGAGTTVKLDQGTGSLTPTSTLAVPLRRMTSTPNFLPYTLSIDAGQVTVWEGLTGVVHTGTGTATVLTVYGRIAAGQNVPAGAYTDTVVATVTF